MLRRIHILAITTLIAAGSVFFVVAEDENDLTVYNSRIITSDINATYIEGEVARADGQQLVVSNGFTTVATKDLPSTGQKAKFRIRIPGKNIKDDKMTLLYVRSRDDGKAGLGERVEIKYKKREKQEINVDQEKVSMTIPSLDGAIKAEATSGDGLIYSSSDPKVALVKDDGSIVAKGPGKADITITQIGNSQYDSAEKSVEVSVTSIDAYSVTFHSSAEEDETAKQIVPTGSGNKLQENSFENGDHKFLGWATEDGGIVKYKDSEEVEDLAGIGENTDLYAVWTGDGAVAALAWAVDIANDDSFTYGNKPAANAIGCYFCGTNKRNKPKGYEKTYVCLTFVAAAYAHGAEDPEIYHACSHGNMPLYENDKNFSKFSCWKKIGKCKDLSINDLEPGDVVIMWSDHNDNSGHVWMYAGDDNLVESTGGGFTAKSISLKSGAASRLRGYGRNSRNYVMRYVGANA